MKQYGNIIFNILDPTGNITALVESETPIDRQPFVAAGIMALYEDVEQVGFVDFKIAGHCFDKTEQCFDKTEQYFDKAGQRHDIMGSAGKHNDQAVGCMLRMAGGEFCGNAAMSAAVLYYLQTVEAWNGKSENSIRHEAGLKQQSYVPVKLRVSGASEPVEVRIYNDEYNDLQTGYRTSIHMPEAVSITERMFFFEQPDEGGIFAKLPVVEMEGISHIIVEGDSPFYYLSRKDGYAEKAVRCWQKELETDGLGIMFLESLPSGMKMKPLVYIPCGDTMFWENSCASGTSAAGMYYAWKKGRPVGLEMVEPGGILMVESDPVKRETWLTGRVRLKARSLECKIKV